MDPESLPRTIRKEAEEGNRWYDEHRRKPKPTLKRGGGGSGRLEKDNIYILGLGVYTRGPGGHHIPKTKVVGGRHWVGKQT